MPGKNALKTYVSGGYYHIYNRGVAKMPIFKDDKDYSVFLNNLKECLSPQDTEALIRVINNPLSTTTEKNKATKLLMHNNYSQRVDLLAYCLMPNHFHILIKQNDERAMCEFMKSIATRYSTYFNNRHHRVGSVFQARYKAVMIETDAQLLQVSRYIHLNPDPLIKDRNKLFTQPSSYPVYMGQVKQAWVTPSMVLGFFNKDGKNTYKDFVETYSETEFDPSGILID